MKKTLFLATFLAFTSAAPAVFAATPVLMEEGAFTGDKMDGTWTRYYPSGQKGAEQHYDHGMRVGHWTKWDEHGQVMEEGDYKNDKLDGTWVRYYPNGKKGSEQHYKSGLRDGHWSKWYDNGQLAESGDFKNDKLDGVWMHYFPDGQPAVESHYKEGMRDGTWKKWNAPQGSEGPQKKVSKLPDTPFDLDFEDSAPAGKTRH